MKKVTIRRALFFTFSVVILLSFLFVTVTFFLIDIPRQKEQTISVLEQNCASIARATDEEMDQIRSVAMNIAHSSLIRENLMHESRLSGVSPFAGESAALQYLLSATIVPNDHVDQVNLYLPSGRIIGTGRISSIYTGNAADQKWYEQVVGREYHNAFVYMGEDEALGKYSTGFYSKYFISYVMEQFDSLNLSDGYIEVKRSLDSILSSAIHYNSVYGEAIYVVDTKGELLFPVGQLLPDYLKELTAGELPAEPGLYDSDGHYVFYAPSQHAELCTVLVIRTRDLMSPVLDYIGRVALISAFTLTLALVVIYFFSKRLSRPIREMCDQVTDFDLTKPLPETGLQTDVEELSTLYATFSDMREKLIDSMNTQLLLQNQEMQSRMLALQAQMNPHFLYNSLAAIQAMADEEMTEEIVEMCQSMSDILRYISSDAEQKVPLREEIRHVKNYLRCMDTRYQGDLQYSIEVPDSVMDVKVPKLCIQLLVENAIKFSATGRPPYRITITAMQDETHHAISVRDIGPGFSQTALDTIREKIAQIDASGLLPSLEINGMGLLNVYIRYKLLHKGRIIFRLENSKPQGACVTIGEYYG